MLINLLLVFIQRVIDLTFELRIFEGDHAMGNGAWSSLRFAVVDLNKSEDYPTNFFSILPIRIDSKGKIASVFTKFFGNKSLEVARGLLIKSLKKKHSPQITAEIERRLNLLEPNPVIHIKCGVCKKFFKTRKGGARKQRVCEECLKRFNRKKSKKRINLIGESERQKILGEL